MYSMFKEVLHEADLKYIGVLLNYGLSVEKIAKDFELDEAYVKEVNPPRLIRFREYRRGFQTPHGLSSMPATLGRSGYLTTDTAQTQ